MTIKKEKMSLGRGLGALLGDAGVAETDRDRVRLVPLDEIIPNQRQPRTQFDETALAELAQSVREQGVLQPIMARLIPQGGLPSGERYELVAGERRWRAARLAGLTTIPVLVRELDDRQSLEIALLENMQREDLNPIETARGCEQLIQEFGYSHQELAKRLGKSRIAVTNHLRLLKLPAEVLTMIEQGALSEGHGRALLGLEQDDAMVTMAQTAQTAGWSVRETENQVRQHHRPDQPLAPGKTNSDKGGRRRDPTLMGMEERLSERLRTPVTITHQKGRGRIIVEYGGLEELERIMERLVREG